MRACYRRMLIRIPFAGDDFDMRGNCRLALSDQPHHTKLLQNSCKRRVCKWTICALAARFSRMEHRFATGSSSIMLDLSLLHPQYRISELSPLGRTLPAHRRRSNPRLHDSRRELLQASEAHWHSARTFTRRIIDAQRIADTRHFLWCRD